MSMNAHDLCAIQESLVSYRKLLEWIPALSEVEVEMRSDRIDTINYLLGLCGNELLKLSEEYRNE